VADKTLIVVGNDGLDRIRRVAERAIPELMTGFQHDDPAYIAQLAREEVHAFIEAHSRTLATATIDELTTVVAMALGAKREKPADPTEGMSDEEILEAMEKAGDVAAAEADALSEKLQLVGKAMAVGSGLARAALMAGMAALTGLL